MLRASLCRITLLLGARRPLRFRRKREEVHLCAVGECGVLDLFDCLCLPAGKPADVRSLVEG
jgi:hypothetical protein